MSSNEGFGGTWGPTVPNDYFDHCPVSRLKKEPLLSRVHLGYFHCPKFLTPAVV